MRRLALTLLLFLSPFAIWIALELFVFPIDLFCPSTAAAQKVMITKRFAGPFYPNSHLEKTERGDLAYRGTFGSTKQVLWETNALGFRLSPARSSTDYAMIVIGDSNVEGAALTQADSLAYQLGDRLHIAVCPYASSTLEKWLNDQRLTTPGVKCVVWSPIERYGGLTPGFYPYPWLKPAPSGLALRLLILVDRLAKFPSLHYLQNTFRTIAYRAGCQLMNRAQDAEISPISRFANDHSMAFLNEELVDPPNVEENIRTTGHQLKVLSDYLAERHILLLFAPIPNKSTVYYKRVPWSQRPLYFDHLLQAATNQGVAVVNVLPEYLSLAESNVGTLYFIDDSHWGPLGVKVMADALARHYQRHGDQ